METLTFVHVISIVAEAKLIKIPLHVFAAYPTVSSVYGTLAIVAPKRFNGIGVCATVNVDTVAVVNNMMIIDLAHGFVSAPFVRIQRGGTLYLPKYRSSELFVTCILDHFTKDFPATLQYAHDGHFVLETSTLGVFDLLVPMAVFILAAYKGFIQFNFSVKLFIRILLETLSNPLGHEPSRLLRDTKI